MNPIPTKAWRCEHCGRLFAMEKDAFRCCRCANCKKRTTYGGGCYCGPCLKTSDIALAESRLKEAKRELARAKKAPIKGSVRAATR